eukprot:scaffold434_cov186-Pinguiococcus_pyrenoidosus.AAC.121
MRAPSIRPLYVSGHQRRRLHDAMHATLLVTQPRVFRSLWRPDEYTATFAHLKYISASVPRAALYLAQLLEVLGCYGQNVVQCLDDHATTRFPVHREVQKHFGPAQSVEVFTTFATSTRSFTHSAPFGWLARCPIERCRWIILAKSFGSFFFVLLIPPGKETTQSVNAQNTALRDTSSGVDVPEATLALAEALHRAKRLAAHGRSPESVHGDWWIDAEGREERGAALPCATQSSTNECSLSEP